MENGINERISLIIKKYNLSERQFSIKIGKKPQSVNAMIKKAGSDLMMSTVIDILKAFPEISVEWLVMGEGDMERKVYDRDELDELRSQNAMLIETNRNLSRALSGIEEPKKEKAAG